MKFLTISGNKMVNVNINKYLIDWGHAVSKPQKMVKDYLCPFWKNSIVLEEFRIPGSLYRIDLISLTHKIAIEVSPRGLHVNYNKFMHGGRGGYLQKLKSDAKKMDWCEKSGFIFVELFDENINNLSKQMFKDEFDIDL